MHALGSALLHAPRIVFPGGFSPTLQLLLRWIHFSAGITWVGLLYFFVLINAPFVQETDGPTRAKVVVQLLPRALWWFRWAAVVTVLAGIWYWMMIVSADAHNGHSSGGRAIGTFFMIWTLAFIVEMGLLMSPAEFLRKGAVFGMIMAVVVVASAYSYLVLNSHGWESNRLLAIGIGGGLGWFMLLNVWGVIWRIQKKLIRWMRESAASGTPLPVDATRLPRLILLSSRTNFVLSFPMLLFMAIASHYPGWIVT
jgi:uncharacterized membrane protein